MALGSIAENSAILTRLAQSAIDFSLTFALVSVVTALALQAVQEALRSWYNRFILNIWLKSRRPHMEFDQFVQQLGYDADGRGLLSLPYWQLTGQISAALSAKLNIDPSSQLVRLLGNIDGPEDGVLLQRARASPPPDPPDAVFAMKLNQEKAAAVGEIAVRAQVGINTLHARMRSYWNIFDYYGTFLFLLVISALLTFVNREDLDPQAKNILTMIIVFAWLATPIIRRMMERLIVFR